MLEFALKHRTFVGLVLLCLVLSLIAPSFITLSNILNVLTQVSVNAVIAFGMTLVIISGGIDLSVGSVLAISGAVSASMIKSSQNLSLSLLSATLVGVMIGLSNGYFIAYRKVQAFIATLSMMTIMRGITYVYTNGKPISGLGAKYEFIGNGRIIGIPIPIIIMTVVFLILNYVLNETKFGRYIYAVGGNEESTRLSGIDVNKVKLFVYAISGTMAALGAILVTSRISSATPTAGTGYELDAIASVVLGGTSLSGGEGTLFGTLVGAVIIGVINNGLNLMNVNPFYQSIVKGGIILLAVLADSKKR